MYVAPAFGLVKTNVVVATFNVNVCILESFQLTVVVTEVFPPVAPVTHD